MGSPATTPAALPRETIRRTREGLPLDDDEIAAFVAGIADGRIGDAQVGAWAMAVRCRGLDTAATAALTRAMRDSGERLDWSAEGLGGPVVDKHSTGGVGDGTSLVLGPLLAACGAFVPMVSGRGLGHTGGTLDKLEAIPGYQVLPERATLRRVVREVGVAIVGAGPGLAPADQRLYAVRDLTATVDSLPLITASILSKKLAAGLQALVLDVKLGNGAFLAAPEEAEALARSLVEVAGRAGLPADALLSAMDQPLAPVAGNALEVADAIARLRRGPGVPAADGTPDDPTAGGNLDRHDSLVLALGARLLWRAGLDDTPDAARRRLHAAWADGRAAERFARMVAALGGPADLLERPGQHLAAAPVQREVPPLPGQAAAAAVQAIDTRALGDVVVALGGGRLRPGDRVDPRVGLDRLAPIGPRPAGAPLARVHAATAEAAEAAVAAVQAAYRLGDAAVAPLPLLGRIVTAIPPSGHSR
ncbi:thymidine phosphorylase [Piscinibacter sakaiensis]|uniref:Thymidine phosphorylase n=1 Tax=Piscinibacter sakaiensis TaxID=1547922 RepID=A0A0K8P0R3_PISS1|nr:thymidine phosphorylase [Piscinibacter sakaiensis]GAP36247.1 thymidine phosphorylase [Piscinibacter sakaiensis]